MFIAAFYRLGSQRFTTGEKGYTIGYTDYDEWGEMPSRLFMNFGLREVDVVKNYTGHEYDAILDVYYAKARFYDAGDRRFTQVDPVKGNILEPMSMVPYVYVVDNPLKYVDPLGMLYGTEYETIIHNDKLYFKLEDIFKSSDFVINDEEFRLRIGTLIEGAQIEYSTENLERDFLNTIKEQLFTGTLIMKKRKDEIIYGVQYTEKVENDINLLYKDGDV